MISKYFVEERSKNSGNENWRPSYHFTAPYGWMNDPNGLIYFQGWYHLFYQYNPKHCDWASMHWGHAVSRDMVHWKDLPIALKPDMGYDNDPEGGCFSGCAVEKDGRLYLFYTASSSQEGRLCQAQCMAVSEDGVHFEKYAGNPLIPGPPEGALEPFRDPKVFSADGKWYMVVGGSVKSENPEGDGRVFLYESEDLYGWRYKGVILESGGKLGTMMECPDLFELDGKWILTCSPMNHPEYNKALYCVGEMDFETGRYTIERMGNLDVGFDYYAPQSFLDAHGNRVMIAWQNGWLWMPWCQDWGPTGTENWRGTMSVPRKVSLSEGGRICLYPVQELESLESERKEYADYEVTAQKRYLYPEGAKSFRLELWIDAEKLASRYLEIGVLGKGEEATVVSVDLLGKVVSLDKSRGGAYGRGRMNCPVEIQNGRCKLLLLVDHSTVEVYVDEGRYCITSNVYPRMEQTECWIRTPYKKGVIEKVRIRCLEKFHLYGWMI